MPYYVKDLPGKQVICLDGGKNYGAVKNVLFDNQLQNLLYLEVDTCFISCADVFRIDDCICCTKVRELPKKEGFCSPLGLLTVNSSGKLLGHCTDVEVSHGYVTKYLFCGEEKFSPKKVLTAVDSIILKASMPKNCETPTAPVQITQTVMPSRYSGDFSFLLGCKTTQQILDVNGRILARAGDSITAEVLAKAKANGKLGELHKKSTYHKYRAK